jgi:hypothetical protein
VVCGFKTRKLMCCKKLLAVIAINQQKLSELYGEYDNTLSPLQASSPPIMRASVNVYFQHLLGTMAVMYLKVFSEPKKLKTFSHLPLPVFIELSSLFNA